MNIIARLIYVCTFSNKKNIFFTVIGFNSNMTTVSWALSITKRILYRICYKMFHMFLNWLLRRQVHPMNPFVLSVQRVRNTSVWNVPVTHTANVVSLKCILLALFSKNINLNIWMQLLAQLEVSLAYAKVTARKWCTIARLARFQFAIVASVYPTVSMILSPFTKL